MIYRTMLKSKIHRATVTAADINYVGSITVDKYLLEKADILEHEKVHVLNLSNGNRLETYTISGPAGSGQICVNGAAARLVAKGDKIIIISYVLVDNDSTAEFSSKVVLVDERNEITTVRDQGPLFDVC